MDGNERLKAEIERCEAYLRDLNADLDRCPQRAGTHWYEDRRRELVATGQQLERLERLRAAQQQQRN